MHPTRVFFVICLDEQRTDYTVCGACNSRGDPMIITVNMRQHRSISNRLVANKRASEKFASMLDKHTHMIVRTADVDFFLLEIRLKPRPEPVICREPPNKECHLKTRINDNKFSKKAKPTVIGIVTDSRCCSNAPIIASMESVNRPVASSLKDMKSDDQW